MTWSNEYRDSVRDYEISREIHRAELRCLKDIKLVILTLLLVVCANFYSSIEIDERFDNIEQKMEIKNDR